MMARTWWPGQSPLGRRLKIASYDQDAPWHTITGVVGDTRYTGLDSAASAAGLPAPRPGSQRADGGGAADGAEIRRRLPRAARAAVSGIDSNQPVARVRTMEQVLNTSVAGRRFHMFLVGVFAALAVTLSVVGLYAVVSFSVAERVQEMGLRLALGARPSNIMALVLAEGLKLVAGRDRPRGGRGAVVDGPARDAVVRRQRPRHRDLRGCPDDPVCRRPARLPGACPTRHAGRSRGRAALRIRSERRGRSQRTQHGETEKRRKQQQKNTRNKKTPFLRSSVLKTFVISAISVISLH